MRQLVSGVMVLAMAWTLACEGGTNQGGGDALADAADTGETDAGPPTLAVEAARVGIDRYLFAGPVPTVELVEAETTTYRFEPSDGPMCMRGGPFRFGVRDLGSDRLVIFLQGGGACWSEFCLAVTAAPPGIPDVDALDRGLALNPLADWNVVYLPYCDGSLFVGDAEVDEDGDGQADRFHRGLQNLSGALRTARERFPSPKQILVVGSSAGGFGTIPATLLVRAAWHDAPIDVFNDSGVGVARPGDEAFIKGLLDEFDAAAFVPETCTDCVVSGHITPLIEWTLERDENIRVAVFSAYYDSIIANIFLSIGPAAFRDALLSETDRIHQRFPSRYKRFFVDGITHTALLGDASGIIGTDLSAIELPDDASGLLGGLDIGGLDITTSGEMLMGDWLQAFVNGDAAWVELLETPGPVPEP